MEINKLSLKLLVILTKMFSNPDDRYTWLTSKHPDFNEEPLRKILRSKKDFAEVVNYLFHSMTRGG